ncbi:MAG: hypothetical protein ABIF01_04950 [Candidatus Micrarchaeota archaeon]
MEVIDHTFKALGMNFKWIVFFSIPFLLAFIIPMLSPLPTYVAMGGTFLRTGSIPEMNQFELGLVILATILSIFSISFALAAINVVRKHNRTLTKIPKEVVEGLEGNVLTIFGVYVTVGLFYFVVYLASYEYGIQEIVGPLITFIASLCLFYVPAAIVIDELRPYHAVRASLRHIYKKPALFLLWLVIAMVSLVALDAIFIILKDSIPFARYILLVLNSLVLMPFLVVLQTQAYLTKYTILK